MSLMINKRNRAGLTLQGLVAAIVIPPDLSRICQSHCSTKGFNRPLKSAKSHFLYTLLCHRFYLDLDGNSEQAYPLVREQRLQITPI